MFRNYLLVTFRTIIRNKGYTLINIVGLATGMASALLILLFIRDELSYDSFHEKADRICRVQSSIPMDTPAIPFHLGPRLRAYFPELEAVVRFIKMEGQFLLGETRLLEKQVALVDEDVLDVFSIELVAGDPETALRQPYAAVITEELARKLFGEENPVGKSVEFQMTKWHVFYASSRSPPREWTVTGVMKSLPRQSHLHFNALLSLTPSVEVVPDYWRTTWFEWFCYTYLLLPEGQSPAAYSDRLPEFLNAMPQDVVGKDLEFSLLPLTDIHLCSHTSYELEPGGDVLHVVIFSAIALFILLIACINYMNLASARSAGRAREVGVRKALGASRLSIVVQFLWESAFLSTLALLGAFALAELCLPLFNSISGKELTFSLWGDPSLTVQLLALTLLVALVAGSYPALFLSSFRPVAVLRRATSTGAGHARLRKTLVFIQFGISIALMIAAAVVHGQLHYLHAKDLGLHPERVAILTYPRECYDAYKSRILENPSICSATTTSELPSERLDSTFAYRTDDFGPEEWRPIKQVAVDYHFFETLGVKVSQGRSFSSDRGSDEREAVVLNEAAVRELGWKEPIGRHIGLYRLMDGKPVPAKGRVIGVVEDFHFESLRFEVVPVLFVFSSTWRNFMLVKLGGEDFPGAIRFLKTTWEELDPGIPFQCRFLDDSFAMHYRPERRFLELMIAFAVLAILIAGLGILGLAAYTAEQRTKEIGIRKVVGASVVDIVLMLSREYVALVALASLLACPVAYHAMRRWLESFAYRIEVGYGVLLLMPLVALAIALATVSYQSIKAALADPVDSLRYE